MLFEREGSPEKMYIPPPCVAAFVSKAQFVRVGLLPETYIPPPNVAAVFALNAQFVRVGLPA